MSNEEFEKTIKEYNEQKNEQLERDTLNNFHKKNDDRESVWKRSDEIKYGFENEYCTDSLKKERSEQHRNENTKRACKQIKRKKFKSFKISPELEKRIKQFAIATSLIGVGIGAIVGVTKGSEVIANNAKNELLQELSEKQLVKYSLSNAPSKLIESWADAKMTQLDQLTQNNESLREVFNSILENEYGHVKRDYYEYIETGSENDREKLVQSAETLQNKLKCSIHTGDYSFKNSKFAYALLRDPDGNFIDYETLDPNLEVYEVVGFNIDDSFGAEDVLYDGVLYRKYDESSSIQSFKMR